MDICLSKLHVSFIERDSPRKISSLKKIIYHGLTVFLKDESEVTDNNVAFGFFVFER